MSSSKKVSRRRNVYIRSEAGFASNLREIGRLRERLGASKNASTARALKRREEASLSWVNGECRR
jgi:hypothetical protein